MKIVFILCIFALLALFKFSAPQLVSIMPEWLNGIIILTVLIGLLVTSIKKLSKTHKD